MRAALSGGAVWWPANLNRPTQTVISAIPTPWRAGRSARRAAPTRGAAQVTVAFLVPHGPAANPLRVALERAPFKIGVPVIANATAEPVRNATRARRLPPTSYRSRSGGCDACSGPPSSPGAGARIH